MVGAVIFILMQSAAIPQTAAAPPQSRAERAAGAFSLDLPPAEPKAADGPAPAPAALDGGPARAAPATAPTTLSLNTPIRDLLADPRGRAVLDADMEGLSSDANLARFERMSLREFQAHTGGQLTDALLAKVAADLADPELITGAAAGKKQRRATGR